MEANSDGVPNGGPATCPLILSDDERAGLTSLAMPRNGAGAGSKSPDRADLCRRWSEHGSGGQAGAGPADRRQVAAAFYGAARGRTARRAALQRAAHGDARIEAVIVRTLESCPESATHWSSRDMAKTSGHPSDQPRLDSTLLPAPRQSGCSMGLLPSRRKVNSVNTKT